MGAGRSDKREVASTAVTQQSNCKGNSDLRLIRTPDRYAGRAYACPRGLCVTLFPQPSPQMHGPGYQARAWRGALKGGRAGQQYFIDLPKAINGAIIFLPTPVLLCRGATYQNASDSIK